MAVDLRGWAVLVTRPEPEARGLASLVAACNGIAVVQPGVRIVPADEAEPSLAALDHLADYDAAIFTSGNAVRCALARHPRSRWPRDLRILAVGEKTRRQLLQAGFPAVTAPAAGTGSEALLAALDAEAFPRRRAVMFAAPEGRTLLLDALGARGITLELCLVYRREPAELDPRNLAPVRSQWGRLVVTATSGAILRAVTPMFPRLETRPLVVPSERVRGEARGLGYALVRVSARPDDESLLEAVARFVDR